MKVIERKMLQAVKLGKSADLGNTRIVANDASVKVYLFNNLIATLDGDTGTLDVITRYQSATTKSRLNVILRAFANTSIYQSDFIWYYADNTYTGNGRTFWGITK